MDDIGHLTRNFLRAQKVASVQVVRPRKIMAKMGISTLRSYKGAQIADAIGLGKDSNASGSAADFTLGSVLTANLDPLRAITRG